jgi:hypothetical protein
LSLGDHEETAMGVLLAAAAAFWLAGCAALPYHDTGLPAFEAGDETALLMGCDSRAAVGHLFCRFPAGTIPTGSIVVVVPPVDCGAESCATVQIWDATMRLVVDRTVQHGKTYIIVPLKSMLGEAPLAKDARGFYPVLVKWGWRDPVSGQTMQAASIGEIRIRVHDADYTPLTFDPSTATWVWKVGDRTFSATDGGRTAVEPSSQP